MNRLHFFVVVVNMQICNSNFSYAIFLDAKLHHIAVTFVPLAMQSSLEFLFFLALFSLVKTVGENDESKCSVK